ncbi:MAG TPA: CBS domain-containing protein [Pseudonocardiaceae bacterium]|nr:CBS domain-containing protein [Pseudonocardiaceae bacterium]
MTQLNVGDVMTHEVRAVSPDTPVRDIATQLVREGIGAVPVVDSRGTLLGVVTVAELLLEPARRPRQPDQEEHTAWQVMTSPARTIGSVAPLPEAARRLADDRVRRLYVVDDGRLVGVLARRDLLRPCRRPDAEIQAEIERIVFTRTLRADPGDYEVSVAHGEVLLTGRLEYAAEVDIAVHLTALIPGVTAVRDRMDWVWDRTDTPLTVGLDV